MNLEGRSNHVVILFCFTAYYFIVGGLYIDYFIEGLQSGEYLDINGFTRIVIPDTFKYFSLGENDAYGAESMKNSLFTALIWLFLKFNWYYALIFNYFVNLASYFYLLRLMRHLEFDSKREIFVSLFFLFNPSTIYYSIGILKETMTILFLSAVIYYFLRRYWYLFFMFSILLIGLRLQFVLFILFMLVSYFIKLRRNSFIVILFIVLCFYPIYNGFFDIYNSSGDSYRVNMNQTATIGSIVEDVRNDYILVSFGAIVIRVIQSLLEPFFNVTEYYRNGVINVFSLVQGSTLILSISQIYRWFKKFFLTKRSNVEPIIQMLLLFCIVVGGLGFIHHRYLFPFIIFIFILDPSFCYGRK